MNQSYKENKTHKKNKQKSYSHLTNKLKALVQYQFEFEKL